jgi:hypothetical protein
MSERINRSANSSRRRRRRRRRSLCCRIFVDSSAMLLVMMSTTSRHLFRWQPTRVTMVRAFTTRTFIHAYSTRQFASFPSSLTTGTTIASNRPRRQCFFSVLSSYGEPGDQRDPSPSVSFHNDGTDRASPIDLEDYWQEEHGLNKAQTEAVTQPVYHAVTRVVAGPGSGKTKVLTCRIAHLLQQTSNTRDRILAVTFTRKAAGEMQQRLEALLQADNDADVEQEDGPPSDGNTSESSVHPALYRVTLGTFHSVCAKILRWNGDLLATLPTVAQVMQSSPNATTLDGGFIIVDQGEQLRMLKECLTEANIDLNQFKDIRPFTVLSAISNAKSIYARGKNPFQPEANQKRLPPLKEIASKVFPRYVQKLHSTNCLDFDDLILMARELLTTQPEVRERLQRRWQHVLIDEFQDTSRTQMDLVKLLTSDSLFVVGDADQSIYSWRGAHVGSLQDLDQDFSNVNTVYLMENYRSTSNIVKAAQKIISSSSSANLRQDMKPKRGSGPAPRVIACGDDKEEGEAIASVLCKRHVSVARPDAVSHFVDVILPCTCSRVCHSGYQRETQCWRVHRSSRGCPNLSDQCSKSCPRGSLCSTQSSLCTVRLCHKLLQATRNQRHPLLPALALQRHGQGFNAACLQNTGQGNR